MLNRCRLSGILLPVLLPATVLLVGCGGSLTPKVRTESTRLSTARWPSLDGELALERDGCHVLSDRGEPGASIVLALTDSVSIRRAPIAHTRAERIVFSHLYETLVNVNCEGDLEPGLATAWTCSKDSTLWVFKIRPDATFWDGTPVQAADVAKSWARNQGDPFQGDPFQGDPFQGDRTPLWTWFNARAKAVSLLDGNRLSVRLPEPQARFPYLLAHPATAVSLEREGWNWPVGSGPFRLRASTPEPLPDLECRPNIHHPDAPIFQTMTFRILPGADIRDLATGDLATGDLTTDDLTTDDLDILLTRDMNAVRFFRDLPGYQPHALPWDRLYLLICPPEQNPQGDATWAPLTASLRPPADLQSVAAASWHDIVMPSGQDLTCPQLTGPVRAPGGAKRSWDLWTAPLDSLSIVHAQDDGAAAEIAERLAALGSGAAHAVSLPSEALDFVLQWQMAGAVILGLDLEFSTGCLQMADLLGKAAWLQAAAFGEESPESTEGLGHRASGHDLMEQGIIHPLAVTRSWVVTRGAWTGFRFHHDGTPVLSGIGPATRTEITP